MQNASSDINLLTDSELAQANTLELANRVRALLGREPGYFQWMDDSGINQIVHRNSGLHPKNSTPFFKSVHNARQLATSFQNISSNTTEMILQEPTTMFSLTEVLEVTTDFITIVRHVTY